MVKRVMCPLVGGSLFLLCVVVLLQGCAGQRKIQQIKAEGVNVDIFPVLSNNESAASQE